MTDTPLQDTTPQNDTATSPDVAATAAPAQVTTTAPVTGSSWRDSVSEEWRGKYPEFKTPDDALKGYDGLVKKLGTNPLVVPGEKATDAERQAFQKRINEINGVPDSVDKYDIKVPEGIPEGFIREKSFHAVKEAFLENGVGTKQAEAITQKYLEAQVEEYNTILAEVQQEKEQAVSTLKDAWGDKFEQNVATAKTFWEKYAPKEGKEAFEDRYGNDPHILQMLYNLNQKSTGDRVESAQGVSSPISGDIKELKMKLAALQSNKAYFSQYDPDHSRVAKEATQIAKAINEIETKKFTG